MKYKRDIWRLNNSYIFFFWPYIGEINNVFKYLSTESNKKLANRKDYEQHVHYTLNPVILRFFNVKLELVK